jgi:DNA ligase-1
VDIPNQRNLHSFFAPPAAASAKASPKMQLGLDKFLKSVSSTTSKKKLKEVEVYNVDEEEGEALARRIAEEEGVDVEASKVLEMEWNSATLVQEAIASTSGSNAAGTSRIPTRKSSAPRVDDIPVPSPLEGKGKAAAEVYDVGARECEDDEAFARRLAEEGDILAVQSVQSLEMTWNIQQGGLASHSKSNLASTSQAAVLSDDGVDPSSSRTSTRSMSLSASPSKRAPGQVTLSSSDGPISYPSLTVDPLDFKLDSPWKEGQPAPYSFLVHALTTLSETRSRIIMLNTLTNALRTLILYHPPSLLPSVYILSNTLSPPYVPTELNIGPSILSKAIQSVSGQTPAALRALYHQFGDPGDVAFAAKSAVRTLIPHAPLTIKGVYASLVAISSAKGQGAAKQKQSLVEKLLVSAKGEEVRYLVRTLSQHLRVGAVRTTILTALARATVLTSPPPPCPRPPADSPYIAHTELMDSVRPLGESPKKKASPDPAREEIIARMAKADALMRRIYAQHPNHDHIVKAVLEAGLDGLSERIPLAVGKFTSLIVL